MDRERKERFLELLEPVYPRLAQYALAMTRNREEAKDLVGEAVLVALERFDSLRSDDGFPGFLYRIVARTYHRSQRRARRFVEVDNSKLERLVDPHATPDVAAELAIVMEALERLPAKIKETMLLFDVADLSHEEIRKIQGGTLSGVKTRLRRGRAMLKTQLGIVDADRVTPQTTKSDDLDENVESRLILMGAVNNYAL